MLCPFCHGRRLFYFQGQLIPCPECQGHGEIHCCDGLQEQPDDTALPAHGDKPSDDSEHEA
jgi:hypothetical protein